MVKHHFNEHRDESSTAQCHIEYMKVNVASSEEVSHSLSRCSELFDYTNVLFNNAGIMDANDGGIDDTDDAIWDRTFDINVKGVYYGCKYGIPHLLASGLPSSVINTASFVALRGAATPQIAYTSSKGAVLAMTREFAVIYGKQQVRFNNLCPGPLRTELLMSFLDSEEKRHRRLVHVPMGASVKPRKWPTPWCSWRRMSRRIWP